MLKLRTLNRRSQTGVQPEIFQSKGGFVELGHFDNHFVESSKKAPQVKILMFFSVDTLKTTF